MRNKEGSSQLREVLKNKFKERIDIEEQKLQEVLKFPIEIFWNLELLDV